MAMSDTLGDMLTRIRNGQSANKEVVEAPASRFRGNVLDVLKREGYIRNFSKYEKRPGIHEFKIELKYYEGKPVISEIKRVSTPRGVMSDNEARAAHVGGEVLCQVF